MVSGTILDAMLLAQQAERKVPEPTRTIVLMALLGILLVGMLLIVATMLGANWVRRQGGFRRRVVPGDVILPRTSQGPPTTNPANASSADTFIGDDTVRNDDTIVS